MQNEWRDFNGGAWENEVKTINFKGISQITIRKEVKTVVFMHLKYMAIGSITAEMVATKRFCRYLALRYPKIKSLLDLTRDIMENYLTYLQTEAKERKNYRSDLYGLRRVIEDVGNSNLSNSHTSLSCSKYSSSF